MSKIGPKQATDYCSYCPKMCHFSCPVSEVEKNEAYTVWGKQQNLKLIRDGAILMDAENAIPAFKCLGCNRGQTFCDHQIDINESLQQQRVQAVSSHLAPQEIYEFEDRFKVHQNPYNKELKQKLESLVPAYWLKKNQPTIFFATCHLLALNPQAVNDYIRLFEKLKIKDLAFFSDDLQCCGHSLWDLGFEEQFKDLASIQFQQLKSAKRIVVATPECAWTLKHLYPRYGFDLEKKVVTLVEYLSPFLEALPFTVKRKSPQDYFYHDSCYQGRYLNQFDGPRKLLELVLGFSPKEFSCHHEESLCSGAGGPYAVINPENSSLVTKKVLDELAEKGGKTLVTACPKALAKFKDVASPSSIVVKDLISFISEGLEE